MHGGCHSDNRYDNHTRNDTDGNAPHLGRGSLSCVSGKGALLVPRLRHELIRLRADLDVRASFFARIPSNGYSRKNIEGVNDEAFKEVKSRASVV